MTAASTIGIMQGRLCPPESPQIQSFPFRRWRMEFSAAREAGLQCIEWIFGEDDSAANPVSSDSGVTEILELTRQTGVAVSSLCADYYMQRPLVASDGAVASAESDHLRWLLSRAAAVGARHIVVPFVDSSSAREGQRAGGMASAFRSLAGDAERSGVELHLETDLAPQDAVTLLSGIGSRAVRATYDIGNSAALGVDPLQEVTMLGPWIGSVHVKDRRRGGTTVPLGSGAADFNVSLRGLQRAAFAGPFILQTARGADGDEVALATRNRAFVQAILAGYAIA